MFRTTFIAATFAAAALTAGTASAAETGPVATPEFTKYFQLASKKSDYERCARFSIAVYNACLETAGGNSQKVRSCRSHYQANVVRCQAIR